MTEPEDKEPKCTACPHTKDQHDKDGFCEVENDTSGICECPGFVDADGEGGDKEEPLPPPEGTGAEGAD